MQRSHNKAGRKTVRRLGCGVGSLLAEHAGTWNEQAFDYRVGGGGIRRQLRRVVVAGDAQSGGETGRPGSVVASPGGADPTAARRLATTGVPVECGPVSSLAVQGQLWSQTGDTASGWELVRALRSSDGKTRIEASALLARAPDCRLPEKAMTLLPLRPRGQSHQNSNEVEMNTPYGLEIIDSCVGCKLHKEHSFCKLSPALLSAFSNSSHPSTYPG